MCQHRLKMIRTSIVYYQGKKTPIEVWQCLSCKKYMIINLKTSGKISLDGKLGEEI